MRKIYTIFPVVLLLSCLWISGCNTKEDKQERINESYPQGGFINYTGSQMIKTPQGYYAFKGNFLYFITPDLKKNTIVCSKPECIHNKNISDDYNYYDYADCDAFFPNSQIGYYDGFLYIVALDFQRDMSNGYNVYKVSMDGTEKTVFYEAEQQINGFCIYKENMYVAETVYAVSENTSEKKIMVKKISMEDSTQVETLFETKDYPDSLFNRLECYGDYCYFYLLYAVGSSNIRYYKININTGKTDIVYDTQSEVAYLYMNDYGTLIEDEKNLPDNEEGLVDWESRYYYIKPGKDKAKEITEKDFPALENMKVLRNMDDKYIYFSTKHSFNSVPSGEELKIYVYTYEGELAAEIPIEHLRNALFFVLPGTDEYLFIQEMTTSGPGLIYNFYYVDKSEFDGGEVTMKKLL